MYNLLLKATATLFLLSYGLLALAEITPSVGVEDAKKAVEQKCKEQCIVLSPKDIAELETNINAAIQEAYKAGLKGWSSTS